jgi:hypothetical protein
MGLASGSGVDAGAGISCCANREMEIVAQRAVIRRTVFFMDKGVNVQLVIYQEFWRYQCLDAVH